MRKIALVAIGLVFTSCAQKEKDFVTKDDMQAVQSRIDGMENKLEILVHEREVAYAAAETLTRNANNTETEKEDERVRKLKEGQALIETNTKMMCDALPGQC